jgi:hypothetical protein
VFLAEQPLIMEIEGVFLGGTPDLVLVSQSSDGKRHLKLVDFKSGKLTAAMKTEYGMTNDCMLGYVSLQVVLYALMLETIFPDVAVSEAVVVFCHNDGTSEFAVERIEPARMLALVVAYQSSARDFRKGRHIDFGDSGSRVVSDTVTSLPRGKGKGRPPKDPLTLLAGQCVDTEWGPAELVEECSGGWNCDFGDGQVWYVDIDALIPHG